MEAEVIGIDHLYLSVPGLHHNCLRVQSEGDVDRVEITNFRQERRERMEQWDVRAGES